MAVLTPAQRRLVRRELAKRYRGADLSGQPSLCSKANVDDVIAGIDGVVEAQMAILNAGFPQPMRSEMTPEQKAEILEVVAKARRELGVF